MSIEIVDVMFIADDRAAIKAVCGDGVRWSLVDRATGERVACELAAELSEP